MSVGLYVSPLFFLDTQILVSQTAKVCSVKSIPGVCLRSNSQYSLRLLPTTPLNSTGSSKNASFGLSYCHQSILMHCSFKTEELVKTVILLP